MSPEARHPTGDQQLGEVRFVVSIMQTFLAP